MTKKTDNTTDSDESKKESAQEQEREEKEQKTEATSQANPCKRRSLLTLVLLNIAVTVILLYGIAYYWPVIDKQVITYMPWNLKAPGQQYSEEANGLTQLETKLKKMENAISVLGKTVSGSNISEEAITPFVEKLTLRIQQLEATLAKLQQQKSVASHSTNSTQIAGGVSSQIEALDKQVNALKQELKVSLKTFQQQNEIRIRMMRYYSKIQSQLISSESFSTPLNDLLTLAKEHNYHGVINAAQPLQTMAESGYVSYASLKERFDYLVNHASADETLDDTAKLPEKIISNLEKLVQVRRVDTKGSTKDAILTRAENAMAEGDLVTAVEEIKHLPTASQKHWQKWLSDAEAHLKTPSVLRKLENAIFTIAEM